MQYENNLNVYFNAGLSNGSSLINLNKRSCVMFKVSTCEFHIPVISSELLMYLSPLN